MKFNPDKDIPDLSGKVIFVTGGNTGLGKETILQLAKHKPAHIYLAARNEARARVAINEIQARAGLDAAAVPITFVELDLASFASVRKAAADFHAQSGGVLHILINNAGIMACPAGTTAEGYEVQFGTNHMGHALLTRLLLPALRATATGGAGRVDVRVVNLSSAAEQLVTKPRPYDWAELKTDAAAASTWSRYGVSKLANAHHARALARREPWLRAVSLHPGLVATELQRGPMASYWLAGRLRPLLQPLMNLLFTNVDAGAHNQLWAAVSSDVQSGHYYHPVGVDGKGTQTCQNDALADELWDWTEKELNAYLASPPPS